MASIYQTVKSCIYKTPVSEQVEVVTKETEDMVIDADKMKENDANDGTSNKKTDEVTEPGKQAGVVWRVSSGLYNVTTGAVGYSVGGIKWAAGKSYDVGTAVYDHVPSLPKFKKKDKKE